MTDLDRHPLRLSRARRVDWVRLVGNLSAVGMSRQQIADHVGIGKSSLIGYLSGMDTEPAFWVGVTLVELWCLRTGLTWADVPTHAVGPSVSAVLRASA